MDEVFIKKDYLNEWIAKYFEKKDLINITDLLGCIEDLDSEVRDLKQQIDELNSRIIDLKNEKKWRE